MIDVRKRCLVIYVQVFLKKVQFVFFIKNDD